LHANRRRKPSASREASGFRVLKVEQYSTIDTVTIDHLGGMSARHSVWSSSGSQLAPSLKDKSDLERGTEQIARNER
jgi:hypothetical protein